MGLTGIPRIISPQLLKVLSEMGHGDRIGHLITSLLQAILRLFPLDTYCHDPVLVMQRVAADSSLDLTHLRKYQDIIRQASDTIEAGLAFSTTRFLQLKEEERFAFYERAAQAYAIVHSGDAAKYGNIILTKGLVAYDGDL